MRRIRWIPATLSVALLVGATSASRAEEPPKPAAEARPSPDAPDATAKSAIERFRREYQVEGQALRIEALKTLSKVAHPTVADELLDAGLGASKEDGDPRIASYAFKGLLAQKSSLPAIGPRISKFLGDAAEASRKRKAKGDYGVRIDPKTGKADETSEEGKAALRLKRERAAMIGEAMKVLDASGHRGKDDVEVLADFLSDGNDDVVVSALAMLSRWKEWSVLPDILDLYELYPTEDKVEVGSTSVDTGSAGSGDAMAAKRAWFAKYGDPDRRRARPAVVRALRKALTDITGEKPETFATPADLREYLRKPDVKRKVKAK